MNRTLVTLALIAAAGVAHAQMQAPSTPGGRAMDSMPGGTSNPNTALPKSPSNATGAEAAAKEGKPQDALLLYDEVLKSDARPSEKREALCGKGDILFEMGGNVNYRRAIEVYDQLAADPEEPIH